MKDKTLLKLIQRNPEQGIQELMKLYGGAVVTICKNFLYDFSADDIEEAVADTFIHFWRNSTSFQLDETYSLKSYLYGIARNVSRDKRRRAKKADIFSLDELTLDLPDDFDLENEVIQRQSAQLLHSCLAQLKEPDRSIFIYRYFYGFSGKELAEKFSLTTKQIENILYRGKIYLQKELIKRRFRYE